MNIIFFTFFKIYIICIFYILIYKEKDVQIYYVYCVSVTAYFKIQLGLLKIRN